MKTIFLIPFLALALPFAHAGEIDIDIHGISYHLIGRGYKNAPRRLNENGAWVFNPGLGVGYDFRDGVRGNGWHGFSAQAKVGFLQDCNDESLYYTGAGVRYRYIFATNIAFGFDLLGILGNGKVWGMQERNTAVLPYADVTLGYMWGKSKIWTLNIAFVPRNTAITATSGTDLLYFTITFGF